MYVNESQLDHMINKDEQNRINRLNVHNQSQRLDVHNKRHNVGHLCRCSYVIPWQLFRVLNGCCIAKKKVARTYSKASILLVEQFEIMGKTIKKCFFQNEYKLNFRNKTMFYMIDGNGKKRQPEVENQLILQNAERKQWLISSD